MLSVKHKISPHLSHHFVEETIAQSLNHNQSPIVIVPGWQDTVEKMLPLHDFLAKKGVASAICSPQPSDGSLTLEKMASMLEPTLTRIFSNTGKKIKLIGFSLGGIILRTWLQQQGGAEMSSTLVTIATPHFGSFLAYSAPKTVPGLQQLQPSHPWLQHLNNNRESLASIAITSIWSPIETTIVPSASSFFPGADNVRILSPIHHFIPKDPRIHEAVLRALSEN